MNNAAKAREYRRLMLACGLLVEGSEATAGALPMQTDAHWLSNLLCGL